MNVADSNRAGHAGIPLGRSLIRESTVIVNDLETRLLAGGPTEGTPDAPTLVFLHDGAWGASADVTWGELLPLAAERCRVIAPDLLGFGGSAKAIRLDQAPHAFRLRHVWALLDALGVSGPVHLIGNSFGGSAALRALTDATLRPRIASVVSISGTGGPWRSARSAELGPFDGTEKDLLRIVGLLCGDYAGAAAQAAARLKWASVPGHYASVMAIHQHPPEGLQQPRQADPFPASLAGVEVPVLLVAGAADPLLEPSWTSHLKSALLQAEIVELPYCHEPNITHPKETWRVLENFLARIREVDSRAAD